MDEVSIGTTVCSNCETPHIAVYLMFGEEMYTFELKDAKTMADTIYQAILHAEQE